MTQRESPEIKDIRQDPMIAGILGRVPERVAETFSEEQLFSLKAAMGANRGHRHPFDVRGSLGVGRLRWYYVFLAGPDRRGTRRREGRCNRFSLLVFWAFLLLIGMALGLGLLLAAKWGFGVDLLARSLELVPELEPMLSRLTPTARLLIRL